jgi:transglutaminase-like putative cysteine protease
VTLLAFLQVYQEQDFVGPSLLGMLVSTAIAVAARRRGLRPTVTAALSLIALAWYLVVVFEGGSTLYGLPTLASLRGLVASAGRAAEQSRVDFAPVPLRPGYVAFLVAGLWMAAGVAEMGTFRWRRPLLAGVPAIALFTIAMVLGTGKGSAFLVALFVAALLTFWGLEASHSLQSWGRWVPTFPNRPDDGPWSVTGSIARRMGASVVAAALVAPVLLPGFGSDLLSWRTGIGGPIPGGAPGIPTGGIDPLVYLQPRLAQPNQSSLELFTVTADRPAYWRLVALANFDGQAWRPLPLQGVDLARDGFDHVEIFPSAEPLTQTVSIAALETEYMPAAAQPASLTSDTPGVFERTRVDTDSGFLQYQGGVGNGMTYTVESRVPTASFDELNGASFEVPEARDMFNAYTELPPELPNNVGDIAERWTRGAETRYEELVAIQERLRDFEYNLEVKNDASADYLTDFLTKTKRGFCQQFATAFAVLARERGFATRVSVGFLPGQRTSAESNLYTVRGSDAHAWPEVWVDGYGWIIFEPTPREDGESQPPVYSEPPTGAGTVPGVGTVTTGGAGGPVPGQRGGQVNSDQSLPGNGGDTLASTSPGADFQWESTFARLAAAVLVGLLLFLIAVPALKVGRTALRYRRAHEPVALAEAAFADFEDVAGDLVTVRRRSESPASYARRVATRRRLPARPAVRLAGIYEAAEYARDDIDPGEAAEAHELARELRGRLWATSSWWERVVRLFSPRGVLG